MYDKYQSRMISIVACGEGRVGGGKLGESKEGVINKQSRGYKRLKTTGLDT